MTYSLFILIILGNHLTTPNLSSTSPPFMTGYCFLYFFGFISLQGVMRIKCAEQNNFYMDHFKNTAN
jgi:hypothetical protein